MHIPSETHQLSLFPVGDSLEEIIAIGIAQLPINNSHDLVALLALCANTASRLETANEKIKR